jgi:nitrogen regulatory protein PII
VKEKEMFNITIITRREKLTEFRDALKEIGVLGLTITTTDGGEGQEMQFSPKMTVEIAVCAVLVETVAQAARRVLNTGNPGDGKLFVSRLNRVVRVRTGEENEAALRR